MHPWKQGRITHSNDALSLWRAELMSALFANGQGTRDFPHLTEYHGGSCGSKSHHRIVDSHLTEFHGGSCGSKNHHRFVDSYLAKYHGCSCGTKSHHRFVDSHLAECHGGSCGSKIHHRIAEDLLKTTGHRSSQLPHHTSDRFRSRGRWSRSKGLNLRQYIWWHRLSLT